MIVEMRAYTIYPGKVGEFIRYFEEHDLEIFTSIMGEPLGYYTTEIGSVNQVIQMWGYESYEERLKLRSAIVQRPGWKEHIEIMTPMVVAQESTLLVPAPFFETILRAKYFAPKKAAMA